MKSGNRSPSKLPRDSKGSPEKARQARSADIDILSRELEESRRLEARWRYALEGSNQGVWDHNFATGEIFHSGSWRQMRGLPAGSEVDTSFDNWISKIHPGDRERVLSAIEEQDSGRVTFNVFEYRERHPDGHWIWIESRGSTIEWDSTGKPTRVVGTDSDITERRLAETMISDISRRLRLALDVSGVGVFEANLDTGVVFRDQRLLDIYGLGEAGIDPGGNVLRERLHPDDRDACLARIEKGTLSGLQFDNAFRIVTPNGEIRHIRSSSVSYVDAHGSRKLIGANWDVSRDVDLQNDLEESIRAARAQNAEIEKAREYIQHVATHDSLSALPNRRGLEERLEKWSSGAVGYAAAIHVDLDRFKQINDTLGHQAGDAVLTHAARQLRDAAFADDFVARVGGDEFVILCVERQNPDEIVALANDIVRVMREPIPFEDHVCRVGASVGLAWTAPGGLPDQLLVDADIALHQAKTMGRGRLTIFTASLKEQLSYNRRISDEMLKALEHNEFIPFYQPQFDAKTLDIVGVETLARWQHPTRGLLTPDAFLKVAEDIDLVAAIDRVISEQAIHDLKTWRALGLSIPRVAVNISAKRLGDPSLIESLNRMQIPANGLVIELLESIFFDDDQHGYATNIAQLKLLGIDIEIDDFGTGHASIVGLLRLSPKRLKIDRSIVKPIVESKEQRALVRSITEIGHSLNIEVVAEGVETEAHIGILQHIGCDVLQGYALARPMPRAALEDFAKTYLERNSRGNI